LKEPISEGHTIVSKEFDDIYFSKEDGVAETKYVFLNGNQIYDRWRTENKSPIRIGELGFGTGLNFFVTKSEWEQENNPQDVIFYSLEKFPLSIETMKMMGAEFPNLETWDESILKAYESFLFSLSVNRLGTNSFEWVYQHPKADVKFRLKLFIGDVLDTILQFDSPIDCFYLDGFAPKKNPEMWTEAVMESIRSLSAKGTSFATFTSAGYVKRNLEAAGFLVKKQSGFGRKREMLAGHFA